MVTIWLLGFRGDQSLQRTKSVQKNEKGGIGVSPG